MAWPVFEPITEVTRRLSPRTWVLATFGLTFAGLTLHVLSLTSYAAAVAVLPLVAVLLASIAEDLRLLSFRRPWMTAVVALWLFIMVGTNIVRAPKQYIDEALFTEAAVGGLMRGQNPYAMDYGQTGVSTWRVLNPERRIVEAPRHPHLDRYVYFPGTLYYSVPWYAVLERLFGWYDQRVPYLGALGIFCLVLWAALRGSKHREAMFIAILLQPFAVYHYFFGFNDVIMLTLLTLVGLGLIRGRPLWAAAALGAAVATKQPAIIVAFFLLPPLLLTARRARVASGSVLATAIGTAALLMAPFVVWSPGDFYHDAVRFFMSNVYPISGVGLSGLLFDAGIVHRLDPFPFWVLQGAIGIPLAGWLFFWSRRGSSIQRPYIAGAAALAAVWFLARYFMPAHISDIMTLVLVGFVFGEAQRLRRLP